MPAPVLEAKKVEAELRRRDGNYAAVARAFGVTRQAVQKFVAKRPALASAVHDTREGMKDTAESKLYEAVKKGKPWAVCFFLKTQAKDRGYVERTETRDVPDEDLDRLIEAELAGTARNGQAPDAGARPRTPPD